MEKAIKIKTTDNHIIFGTLNYQSTNKKTVLIFVHGITGNQNEHQYFNAVPFFTKKSFTTFRFDFYSRNLQSRQLQESSITTHVSDLQTVINYFKKKYKKIILIGHSLGAPVILLSDLSAVAKIILWDPTTGFKDIKEKNGYYSKKLDNYVLNWGKAIMVSKKMIDEWKNIQTQDLINKITVPCKFIFAGKENKYTTWKPFLKKIKAKNDHVVIKGASHVFIEEGVEQKLFIETLGWIV